MNMRMMALVVACATISSMHAGVQEITSEQAFNQAINAGNVVVDFYAKWCGPCKRMHKVVADVSAQLPQVKFVKVDIEAQADIASKYGVRSMPTFVFFQNGNKIKTITGAKGTKEFRDVVASAFGI